LNDPTDPTDHEELKAEWCVDDEAIDEVELLEADLFERWIAWADIIDR
jgi:hypothetical protein